MTLAGTELSKPKDWQPFERSMRSLMAALLKDPNTLGNGRAGQSQAGVDVYGYRNGDTKQLVGVQCKKRFEDPITKSELIAELEKAKTFRPPLTEFILATTAPRDQKIQEEARLLTEQLSTTDRPIKVFVWGWDDIEERAAEEPDAWQAFDPTANVFAVRAHKQTNASLSESNALIREVRRHDAAG